MSALARGSYAIAQHRTDAQVTDDPTELTNVQRHARRINHDGVGDGEFAEESRRCKG